jgi:hypothetical protein
LKNMHHNKKILHCNPFYYFHYLLIFFGVFLLLQGLIAENCKEWPLLYKCVKYADEVFVLLSFLFIVSFQLMKGTVPLKTGIEWPLALFLLVGVTSSIMAQVPLSIAGVQFFLYIKGFLLFYIFANLAIDKTILHKYLRIFSCVAFIIFALGVMDFAAPNWFRAITGNVAYVDYRAGVPSVKSLFTHPGVFGWFMSFVALFILAFFFVSGKLRYFSLSILFSYGVVFSMRRKALAGLLTAAATFFLFVKLLNKKNVAFFVILCLAVLVPNYDKIEFLYSNVVENYAHDYVDRELGQPYKAARNVLYFTSVKIAVDYFPLGAGLGRYGSWMSVEHYSPLYDKYGISQVKGLSREEPHFICDTFWPMIIGETGWAGLLLYCWIILTILRKIYEFTKNTTTTYFKTFSLGALMIFCEGLIESVAQPVFVHPPECYFIFGATGVTFALLSTQEGIKILWDNRL